MKKVIACLLILVMAFGLCACDNKESKKDYNDKAEKYVGTTWVSNKASAYSAIYSIRFLPQGKAIWNDCERYDDDNSVVTDNATAKSGEWILDDERIILFFDEPTNLNTAYIFNIKGETLVFYGREFTKTN